MEAHFGAISSAAAPGIRQLRWTVASKMSRGCSIFRPAGSSSELLALGEPRMRSRVLHFKGIHRVELVVLIVTWAVCAKAQTVFVDAAPSHATLYLQWATALHKVDPNLKLGGRVFEGVSEDINLW